MKILLWPVIFILMLTGKFIAVIIGLVISILGFALCLTIIGAVIGIPLIIFGVLLMAKGIF